MAVAAIARIRPIHPWVVIPMSDLKRRLTLIGIVACAAFTVIGASVYADMAGQRTGLETKIVSSEEGGEYHALYSVYHKDGAPQWWASAGAYSDRSEAQAALADVRERHGKQKEGLEAFFAVLSPLSGAAALVLYSCLGGDSEVNTDE